MSLIVDLRIFSPRWGHEDTYSVELDHDFMEITMGARKARAAWRDNLDPEWTGEPIKQIMNNDNIHPPAITQDLFEHVWKDWRYEELSAQEVEEELNEIAKWVNAVTSSKPKTKYWEKYF